METVIDFIFLGSKITADGNCSQEIQRCLLLGRKAKTNLDSILKSRDITLTTKSHLVKAMVFPVVMYGCELDYKESWVLKNWFFWTVVLEKTLASSLDTKGIKPVNPKGNQLFNTHWKDWCWSWNFNTLATWYKLTHCKRPWCWERLKAGGEGDDRWDGWITSPTWWMSVWASSGSWWWTGKSGVLQSIRSQSQTRLSNWTELNWTDTYILLILFFCRTLLERTTRKKNEFKPQLWYLQLGTELLGMTFKLFIK